MTGLKCSYGKFSSPVEWHANLSSHKDRSNILQRKEWWVEISTEAAWLTGLMHMKMRFSSAMYLFASWVLIYINSSISQNKNNYCCCCMDLTEVRQSTVLYNLFVYFVWAHDQSKQRSVLEFEHFITIKLRAINSSKSLAHWFSKEFYFRHLRLKASQGLCKHQQPRQYVWFFGGAEFKNGASNEVNNWAHYKNAS